MESTEKRRIIQSSFHELNPETSPIIPYGNGLVNGIIRAFQQDLHLVLRPDDIWLSILTQFNMFVNGNSEHLRTQFVAHEGKKELIIDAGPQRIDDIDMGKFAQANDAAHSRECCGSTAQRIDNAQFQHNNG